MSRSIVPYTFIQLLSLLDDDDYIKSKYDIDSILSETLLEKLKQLGNAPNNILEKKNCRSIAPGKDFAKLTLDNLYLLEYLKNKDEEALDCVKEKIYTFIIYKGNFDFSFEESQIEKIIEFYRQERYNAIKCVRSIFDKQDESGQNSSSKTYTQKASSLLQKGIIKEIITSIQNIHKSIDSVHKRSFEKILITKSKYVKYLFEEMFYLLDLLLLIWEKNSTIQSAKESSFKELFKLISESNFGERYFINRYLNKQDYGIIENIKFTLVLMVLQFLKTNLNDKFIIKQIIAKAKPDIYEHHSTILLFYGSFLYKDYHENRKYEKEENITLLHQIQKLSSLGNTGLEFLKKIYNGSAEHIKTPLFFTEIYDSIFYKNILLDLLSNLIYMNPSVKIIDEIIELIKSLFCFSFFNKGEAYHNFCQSLLYYFLVKDTSAFSIRYRSLFERAISLFPFQPYMITLLELVCHDAKSSEDVLKVLYKNHSYMFKCPAIDVDIIDPENRRVYVDGSKNFKDKNTGILIPSGEYIVSGQVQNDILLSSRHFGYSALDVIFMSIFNTISENFNPHEKIEPIENLQVYFKLFSKILQVSDKQNIKRTQEEKKIVNPLSVLNERIASLEKIKGVDSFIHLILLVIQYLTEKVIMKDSSHTALTRAVLLSISYCFNCLKSCCRMYSTQVSSLLRISLSNFSFVLSIEKNLGLYTATVSFLKCLNKLAKFHPKENIDNLYGLVKYATANIFSSHDGWKFNEINQRWNISRMCLSLINQICKDSLWIKPFIKNSGIQNHSSHAVDIIKSFFTDSTLFNVIYYIVGNGSYYLDQLIELDRTEEGITVENMLNETLTLVTMLLSYRFYCSEIVNLSPFEESLLSRRIGEEQIPLITLIFELIDHPSSDELRISSCRVISLIAKLTEKYPRNISSGISLAGYLSSKVNGIIERCLYQIYSSTNKNVEVEMLNLIHTLLEVEQGLGRLFLCETNIFKNKPVEEHFLSSINEKHREFIKGLIKSSESKKKEGTEENSNMRYECVLILLRNIINYSKGGKISLEVLQKSFEILEQIHAKGSEYFSILKMLNNRGFFDLLHSTLVVLSSDKLDDYRSVSCMSSIISIILSEIFPYYIPNVKNKLETEYKRFIDKKFEVVLSSVMKTCVKFIKQDGLKNIHSIEQKIESNNLLIHKYKKSFIYTLDNNFVDTYKIVRWERTDKAVLSKLEKYNSNWKILKRCLLIIKDCTPLLSILLFEDNSKKEDLFNLFIDGISSVKELPTKDKLDTPTRIFLESFYNLSSRFIQSLIHIECESKRDISFLLSPLIKALYVSIDFGIEETTENLLVCLNKILENYSPTKENNEKQGQQNDDLIYCVQKCLQNIRKPFSQLHHIVIGIIPLCSNNSLNYNFSAYICEHIKKVLAHTHSEFLLMKAGNDENLVKKDQGRLIEEQYFLPENFIVTLLHVCLKLSSHRESCFAILNSRLLEDFSSLLGMYDEWDIAEKKYSVSTYDVDNVTKKNSEIEKENPDQGSNRNSKMLLEIQKKGNYFRCYNETKERTKWHTGYCALFKLIHCIFVTITVALESKSLSSQSKMMKDVFLTQCSSVCSKHFDRMIFVLNGIWDRVIPISLGLIEECELVSRFLLDMTTAKVIKSNILLVNCSYNSLRASIQWFASRKRAFSSGTTECIKISVEENNFRDKIEKPKKFSYFDSIDTEEQLLKQYLLNTNTTLLYEGLNWDQLVDIKVLWVIKNLLSTVANLTSISMEPNVEIGIRAQKELLNKLSNIQSTTNHVTMNDLYELIDCCCEILKLEKEYKKIAGNLLKICISESFDIMINHYAYQSYITGNFKEHILSIRSELKGAVERVTKMGDLVEKEFTSSLSEILPFLESPPNEFESRTLSGSFFESSPSSVPKSVMRSSIIDRSASRYFS